MPEQEDQFQNEEAKKFSKHTGQAASNIGKMTGRLKELAKINKTIGEGFWTFLDASNELNRTLSDNKDALDKIHQGQLTLNEAEQIQQKAKADSIKLERRADNLAAQLLGKKSKLSNAEKAAVKAKIAGMKKAASEQNKSFSGAVKQAAKGETFLAKSFEGLGKKFKGIGLEKAGGNLTKMGQAARKAAVGGGGFVKQLAGMMGIMKKLKNLNPFGILFTILSFMWKTMLKVNGEVAQLGRNLQISADHAGAVRRHFVNVANDLGVLGIEYEEIMKAQSALNNALGTAATMIHSSILGGMAVLVERAKLSQQAAVGFAKAAIVMGDSVERVSDMALQGSINAAAELGVRLDLNKALDTTGKLSGEVRAIFFTNYELMGKTVARAQSLGLEMKTVRDNSRGMLDFQNSISKEMEAEIFLGRQLNLDRLRLLSVTGDYGEYMEELVAQAGTFLEFSQMSTFERIKLSEALNMNVDALADMLMSQATLNELSAVLSEQELEQVKANREQLSLQEAFNAAVKKLKVILVNLMAELENFGFMRKLSQWVDKGVGGIPGGVSTAYTNAYDPVVGRRKPGNEYLTSEFTIQAKDYRIETLPEDSLYIAGGTNLGNGSSNGLTQQQGHEIIETIKENNTFEYNGFAAVKEARHYGGKIP